MGLAVYSSDRRFQEKKFNLESDFEEAVKANSKILFGSKTIYIDLKNRVDSRSLGGTIPDGFLFDFSDKEDPQFYLIEVELSKHSFNDHIFPQITKFFAFYKNLSSRGLLIEKLYEFVMDNAQVLEEMRLFSGTTELYKSIKNIVENSQNILLIIDDQIPQIKEIQETYTDTWAKFVKVEILKQYNDGVNNIFTLDPEFEQLKEVETTAMSEAVAETTEIFNESYHLDGVDISMVSVYNKIKQHMANLDSTIVFNPQHYYISIRKNKNFAFIKTRIHKLKIVVMLPIEEGIKIITSHRTRRLSEGVQNFYNGPCFEVQIESDYDLEEVFSLLEQAYRQQLK